MRLQRPCPSRILTHPWGRSAITTCTYADASQAPVHVTCFEPPQRYHPESWGHLSYSKHLALFFASVPGFGLLICYWSIMAFQGAHTSWIVWQAHSRILQMYLIIPLFIICLLKPPPTLFAWVWCAKVAMSRLSNFIPLRNQGALSVGCIGAASEARVSWNSFEIELIMSPQARRHYLS